MLVHTSTCSDIATEQGIFIVGIRQHAGTATVLLASDRGRVFVVQAFLEIRLLRVVVVS